jgi:hypothetical protein
VLNHSAWRHGLAIGDTRVTFVLLCVTLVVAAAAVYTGFLAYFTERQLTIDEMTRFGDRFVREFERPLIQPVPEAHRIRARLRASPERKRLDILLAPSDRGRYPNLSDHKENLAYDIVRVVQLLGDQSFVSGPFYGEGDWVVVPFQFKGWSKQAGKP